MNHIDIVFDGPPSAEAGRFVEVEDAEGRSISIGEWVDRGDGTWALRLASRPAPVAPPTEEWEDPEPYESVIYPGVRRAENKYGGSGLQYKPRTREQYEADQKPVVPVDALGFPTQVGATFNARFAGNPQDYTPHHFRVSEPGRFWLYSVGNYRPHQIDPTSIEDVRPADGRGGQ